MKKTKKELKLLELYLPKRYYGHEARNNAIYLARKLCKELEEKYNDLIMAVNKKFKDETRHETAKRYIIDAEKFQNNTASEAREEIA